MELFLQASAGLLLGRLAEMINYVARWAISLTIGVFVVLLLLRWIMDALQASPFGRVVYYLRRPTDSLISHVRSTRFYHPLRQSLKFNPAILMALIGLLIVWYIAMVPIGNLTTVIGDLGMSLDAFGEGRFFKGFLCLVGTLLMGVLCFLMGMMTLIFINWISGWFEHVSFWALQRIGPLLRYIESKGNYAEWSFLILWLALYLASILVQIAFFGNLQVSGRQL